MESQEGDPVSLLNWTRKLIGLRKSNKAFWADSDFTPVFNEKNPYPMVYTRSDGNETWIIALNPTGRKQSVTLPALPGLRKGVSVKPEMSYGKASLSGTRLTMGPTSVFIGKLN